MKNSTEIDACLFT